VKATLARTEPGARRIEARASRAEIRVDDGLARLLGIPAFGIVIPRITDSLGEFSVEDPAYWAGSAWFVLLSAAVWHANRWAHFEQRRHGGWFDYPVRKIAVLLLTVLTITSSLTVSAMLSWYAWLQVAPCWPVIHRVTAMVVICVICVLHIYETVFLIREHADDRVRGARLERARAEAEREAFRAQVDPRFLFHSLNTLGHLIATNPTGAAAFNEHLAELQRYLLRHSKTALVTLEDELAFLADYVALMKIRFGDSLTVRITEGGAARTARLAPTALQLLVQRAIERHGIGEARPLVIAVTLGPASVEVTTCDPVATGERDGAFTAHVPLAGSLAEAR
jgi:Histidine kinase